MEENIYKNASVVIVDDIEEVLRATKNCLEFEELNVTCFSNPIEGLEYLKTNKADVLLLDFFMPEMNGDEFVEKLREYNQETIVILQTGYADKIPPLEMIDKMNIQGYLDKVKGENELILMTKSAIKTSFLNKKIREKDQEIAKMNYKKAIMGNLIANLANEAKDQLMQISGMNESIKMSTNDYETENKVIENALKKTYELYEALNFENLQNIDVLQFNKIINILLKPTILLNNVNLSFETENKEIIINEASNNIYLIIKLVEILVENKSKDINIKVVEDNDKTYLLIIAEEIINSINLQEVELLSNGKDLNIENNIIKFRA